MSYTPTLFAEGTAPGISAVELNKLGNGVQAAAAAADTALSSAIASEVGALSATGSFIGISYRVRTYDGAVISNTTSQPDPVLSLTFSGAANSCFRVRAHLLYVADDPVGAQAALSVYNGHSTRETVADGGIAAYGYAETPIDGFAQPTLLVWDNTTSSTARLDGAGDSTQAAMLTALVVNGNATGDVVIAVVAAVNEGVSATDFRLLAGSYLTVEQLS